MNPHSCLPNIRVTLVALAALAGTLVAAPAAAQQATYPTRAVSLVVPFAPGSTLDVSARVFSREFSKQLGQPFNVENRPGIVSFRTVKNATPDGHTLLWHSGGATIAQTVLKEPDFDIRKDFSAVSLVVRGPLGLFVQGNSPYKSVKELLDDARKSPGKLAYASTGVGSTLHFVSEVFKGVSKADFLHVPYKGGSDAETALQSGQVQILFYDMSLQTRTSRDKVRAIALAGKERSPFFPDVPTITESGGPEYEAAFWVGLFAPSAAPRAVVERLHGALRIALQSAEVQDYMKKQSYLPALMSSEDAQKLMAREVEQWTRVVRDVGVPLQ